MRAGSFQDCEGLTSICGVVVSDSSAIVEAQRIRVQERGK
jgi:hypothetical protein